MITQQNSNSPTFTYFVWKICDNLIDNVVEHDYSYQFSDDMNIFKKGQAHENQIKQKIKDLIELYNIKPEGLLSDCLNNRLEQYDNGLTHKTIKQWFSPYLNK